MSHELVRVIAQYLVYVLIVFLPIAVVLFTDRLRHQPNPGEYAVLLALCSAIGVLLFLPALSIICATALAALGMAWLAGRYALSALSVSTILSASRIFPNEEATLTIEVENRKPLPLAWIIIVHPVHHGLVRPGKDMRDLIRFSGGIELLDNLGHALVIRTAIGPFQRLSRTYRLVGLRRGVYGLGPASVDSGDAFGIFRQHAEFGRRQELVVYPRVYTPDEIGLPFREALGETRSPRALVEDPILLAGSREYRPGDALRHMHWKATARTGELQVRTADPSTTGQIILVVNLNTFPQPWQGVDLDRMEATIEVAASVGLWLLERGLPIGLRSTGIIPGIEAMPRLQASANPRQPALLLEHLARIVFSGRFTAESVLEDEAERAGAGTSIVFVTSIITPSLIATLTGRRLSGRTSVVYCGRFAAPVIRGVPIYLVTPPREVVHAAS